MKKSFLSKPWKKSAAGGSFMQTPRLDKDATIYNYRLVKRIRHQPILLLVYSLLPVVGMIVAAAAAGAKYALWTPAGLIGLAWVYGAIAWTDRSLRNVRHSRKWSIIFRLPWYGWLPSEYVPVRTMMGIHLQLLGVGLAVIAALYPWLPVPAWVQLMFLHLWAIFPRLFILWNLKRTQPAGLLKINDRDTSYYME